jgi:hypothetical protein
MISKIFYKTPRRPSLARRSRSQLLDHGGVALGEPENLRRVLVVGFVERAAVTVGRAARLRGGVAAGQPFVDVGHAFQLHRVDGRRRWLRRTALLWRPLMQWLLVTRAEAGIAATHAASGRSAGFESWAIRARGLVAAAESSGSRGRRRALRRWRAQFLHRRRRDRRCEKRVRVLTLGGIWPGGATLAPVRALVRVRSEEKGCGSTRASDDGVPKKGRVSFWQLLLL